MAVDLVQLSNFTANFVDASITPPYTTRLNITSGTVKGLSSEPSARSDFKIQDAIDKSAANESSGQMNPMNAFQYTEGEELHFIDFEPGQSKLNPRTTKKLNALAGFLRKRPAIKLGIKGTANRRMDLADIVALKNRYVGHAGGWQSMSCREWG